MRRIAVPLGITAALLGAQLASVPVLSDPVAGPVSPSLHLSIPWLYLVLAPVFTLWDGISMLSLSRLKGFLVGLVVFYIAWRISLALWRRHASDPPRPVGWLKELAALAISAILLLTFLLIGALWHRPMLSLAGVDRDQRVVDFHSHTNLSHDVRNTLMQGFDAEANRRWHERAGFDVVFITDHNVQGSGTWSQESGTSGHGRRSVLCPGIEVSAWRAHIVLLGDSVAVDRSRYNGSFDALLTLLRVSDTAYGALSVASLPEYRRNHWDHLDQLVAAGLDGLEVVNAAPQANELGQAARDSVIALARSHNLLAVGVSDSHGWGATSMVWNLVRAPSSDSTHGVCASVLHQLRLGFPAVRVLERHRVRPDSWWPMWLTPIGVVWETWRSLGWGLTLSWLVWIWVLALWRIRKGPRRWA
jgi:hypothetical protein